MNIAVYKEPNLTVECTELLKRYMNHEEYRKFRDDLVIKHGIEGSSVYDALSLIIELGEHVYQHLEVSEDRLSFFFKEHGEGKWCCAELLLMYKMYSYEEGAVDSPFVPYAKEDLLKYYTKHLIWVVTQNDEEMLHEVNDEAALFHTVDCLEMDEQDKWLCLMVYHHYDRYLEELLHILDQATALYEQKMHIVQPLLDHFQRHYQAIIQENPTKLLSDTFQIKLALTQDVKIIPYLMGCNMVTLINHADKPDLGVDHLYVGILFENLAAAITHSLSDDKLCKMLKTLSDTSKFEILKFIREEAAYGQEIAERFQLTTATISHHMNALINNGFISIEKKANRVYYQMDKERVEQFLEQLRASLMLK